MEKLAQEGANSTLEAPLGPDQHDLRRVLHLLPVAAYTCDAEGQITAYNSRAASLWGRTPKLRDPDDRYSGAFRLFNPDGSPLSHGWCWMALALRMNQTYDGHEIVIERPDGSRRIATAHAHPFQDEQDNVTGALNVLLDVTEQKQAQEQIRNSQMQLEEFERQRSTFLARLAHELRNSLVPLSVGVQLMKMPHVPEEQLEESRQMMEQQMQHMVRLIDDLLDLSRISQGQFDLLKERISLDTAIQRAVVFAQPLISRSEQKLSVEIPDEPIYVNGDLVRLTQVFANLLINAAKFTPRRGVILLKCRRRRGRVLVSVQDNGIGIRKELLDRIFDTFTQLDRSMESKHGGIGIGLSLVKGLVEMHEGSIDARSEGPGEGSEFIVNLPIMAGEPMPEITTQDVCSPPPVLPQRILVVDDQVVVARSIACLLEAMGHDVCEAYDGEEALEIMVEYRPDVILCDIVMPKFDGYELARHVRSQDWGRDVLLIAYSGSGMREHVEKSLEAGFDHHLIKPLKIDALVSVLEELQQEPV